MEDKHRSDIERTIEYYEKNAEEFVTSTINADVTGLYKHFEKYISPGCRILDLGCGSGRDSKYFAEKGYDVVAADPSAEMCDQTHKTANVPTILLKAEEIAFEEEFDAIWACASLLHVHKEVMNETIYRLARALKHDGILYASWKYGGGEHYDNGRFFSDYKEESIKSLMFNVHEIVPIEIWKTEDVRLEKRNSFAWINVIAKKV
jgi:SAM-dependent methyltransferase